MSGKTEEKVLQLLRNRPTMTIPELAKNIDVTSRTVERLITKLKREKMLERIGSAKGGYWKVL